MVLTCWRSSRARVTEHSEEQRWGWVRRSWVSTWLELWQRRGGIGPPWSSQSPSSHCRSCCGSHRSGPGGQGRSGAENRVGGAGVFAGGTESACQGSSLNRAGEWRRPADRTSALRMEVWAIHCLGNWQELHGSELTAAVKSVASGWCQGRSLARRHWGGGVRRRGPSNEPGAALLGTKPVAETRGRCGETLRQCHPGHLLRADGPWPGATVFVVLMVGCLALCSSLRGPLSSGSGQCPSAHAYIQSRGPGKRPRDSLCQTQYGNGTDPKL